MNGLENGNTCPRCGSLKLKPWADLTDEQKFIAERLPMSAEYPSHTRNTHRFCTQCWFEQTESKSENA